MDDRLNHAPCGYLSLTNEGIIAEVNRTFLMMTGYEKDEIIGIHLENLLTKANQFMFHSSVYPALQNEKSIQEVYMMLCMKNKEKLPVMLCANNSGSSLECIFISIEKRMQYENEVRRVYQDLETAYKEKNQALSELKLLHKENEEKTLRLETLNQKLEELASIDNLTGLRNRRVFIELLDEQIEHFQQTGDPFSVFILDIDHFKRVNDTWGHLVGDQFLRELAKVMTTVCRKEDLVARYGGEEFVVLLPHISKEKAIPIAERLRSRVETWEWEITPITVSIGVSTATDGDTQHTILAKADNALYESKNQGRNRVTYASTLPEMSTD